VLVLRSLDVALLHAPSVYDFRKMGYVHYGPISDVIPSKPIFDMYPAGFFSLASYLEERGLRVGIFNIAARMVNDERFDPSSFLKGVEAKVFALDLHWLVHAHGALELARLVKELKGVPVVLGGFSATYYWREILENHPYVDAVVLGDSTEPCFYQLVERVERGELNRLSEVCNTAYRDSSGRIRYNGITYVPETLDELAPNYEAVVKVMVRSGISNSLPWSSFLEHPVTAVITYKGCPLNCLGCGGSSFTYHVVFRRSRPGVKRPETLVREFREITERLRAPIFFVNDLQVLGRSYIEKLTRLLAEENSDVEIFFEFFTPPPRDILELYRRAGERVYLQISPESHEEAVRMNYGRPYTNSQLLHFVRAVRELSFERLDLYFMVGLPLQTEESVTGLGAFFEQLHREAAGILDAFVAPLAPFVDPGSPAFHTPRKYGYRMLARTLSEHRQLLLEKRWYRMLNYETEWMDREAIARATYKAVLSLLDSKHKLGVIGDDYYREVRQSVLAAMSGAPPSIPDSKETLREEELYPKHSLLRYITPKLVREIIVYKLRG
jgi:B12-binding domain/radical SAM domain protein